MDETPSKVLGQTTTIKPARKSRVAVKGEPSRIPARDLTVKTPRAVKTESSSSSFTPLAAADINGLPAFIGRTWGPRFLPAVYRLLYESEDPMMLGVVGTDAEVPGKETVAMVQKLINKLYPNTEYTVEWGDVICSRAVSRIGERRSSIAKAEMQVVDQKFDKVKYYTDFHSPNPGEPRTALIASDARYAIRPNGPAFYKVATPEDVCCLPEKDPRYIKPDGFLESRDILTTMSTFIKDFDWKITITKNDKGKDVVDSSCSRLPVGLLAMATAAVERGYKLHTTGIRVSKPLDFSAAHSGTAVAGYITAIKKFTPSRWESMCIACGGTSPGGTPQEIWTDQDGSLDGIREHMYQPSSP
ncbi:hypothetical protein MSAN_01749700 [Mycena sanguinolenta]|uniref:Uncharacterized protein n=1 Tax=Mycena sanguinolenta TaxID=230812 RepID=A0A8H6XX16_9AGAR|nr:hypothetical protein MSAN_01749700 [Mycena sanguinolenta]